MMMILRSLKHLVIKSCHAGACRARGSEQPGKHESHRTLQSDGTHDPTTLPGAWATRARPLGTAESSSCLRAVNGELLASLQRRDCAIIFVHPATIFDPLFFLRWGVGLGGVWQLDNVQTPPHTL